MPDVDTPITLRARNGAVVLAGSLWQPAVPPSAVLLMHPGSGPADRDNGALFPPIRRALLEAGAAVASFEKRGVGGSQASWLEGSIEQQADDLLLSLEAAAAHVPDLPRAVFGHSEGGWVVLEAAHRCEPDQVACIITNAGPAVSAGVAERFASDQALERIAPTDAARARAVAAVETFFSLAEAGAPHAQMLALLAERADDLAHLLGDSVPDERLWGLFVRLAAYDPLPRLRSLRVPMLAIFGADDVLTPSAESVAALRGAVDPALLRLAVLPDAGHRMTPAGAHDFVPGYLETIIAFALEHGR